MDINNNSKEMRWLNFLHLYQPVNEDAHNIKDATEKSYLRIVRALEEHPEIKFTVNITGCLFLRWEELGFQDLILRIKDLINKKQIELVGSAAYHPLLPLIEEDEIRKQINENEKILRKYLGQDLKLRGFFCPEMAYSKKVGKIIKEQGYDWIILDEISYNGSVGQVDCSKVYLDKNTKLKIIFRSRSDSYNYVPEIVEKSLRRDDIKLMVTATDGELYGLRHEDPTGEFENLLKKENLDTKLFSEYISENDIFKKIKLLNSSWDTTEEEMGKENFYSLWNDKDNDIQQSIWKLANLAYKNYRNNLEDENVYWIRWHLVRGLASCTFWWASAKDFSHVYGPYAWSPDLVERGINELIRSIRAVEDERSRKTKIKSEKLYIKIKQKVWNKHWTYYWKKN